MDKKLTAVQAQVLNAVRRRVDCGEPAPTYRELCAEFGWASTGTVRDHLRALARKGYLKLPGGHRQLQLREERVPGHRGISWVIVGGESGPRARPMQPDWATDLRDQCRQAEVPFFFKQWGGKNKKQAGRVLDGRTWDQMPDVAPSIAFLQAAGRLKLG